MVILGVEVTVIGESPASAPASSPPPSDSASLSLLPEAGSGPSVQAGKVAGVDGVFVMPSSAFFVRPPDAHSQRAAGPSLPASLCDLARGLRSGAQRI
jgi:hypothetical protein